MPEKSSKPICHMCMGDLPVCMCTRCMSGAQGDQKRTLDPLELAFQMVVRHHIGAELSFHCPLLTSANSSIYT